MPKGGPMPNSGRPVGSINKITGKSILEEISKRDIPFAQGLAEDYARVRASGDYHILQKYQHMILNKVVADKTQVDLFIDHDQEIDAIVARLSQAATPLGGTDEQK